MGVCIFFPDHGGIKVPLTSGVCLGYGGFIDLCIDLLRRSKNQVCVKEGRGEVGGACVKRCLYKVERL